MTQPTSAELRSALDVLQRQLGTSKRYTRRDLDNMTPEQVAAALNESPDAFDAIEEDES